MLTNLLIYRWLLLRICYGGAVAWSMQMGLWQMLYTLDATRITWLITVIFAVAWVVILWYILRVSTLLNSAKRNGPVPASHIEADKAAEKIVWLGMFPEIMVELGMAGTLIGIAIALIGLDWSQVTDAAGLKNAVPIIISGFASAITTTLMGLVMGRATAINVRMLTTAHAILWADRVQAGLVLKC